MTEQKKKIDIYVLLTEEQSYGSYYLKSSLVYLEDGKPRNFTSSFCRSDEIRLESLGLNAHWYEPSIESKRGEWLTSDLGYYQAYCVNRSEALGMAKTLTMIEKKMSKISETLGYPKTYGECLTRFGAALGVKGYLIYRKRNGSSYDDSEFQTMSASDILFHIVRLAEAKNHLPQDCAVSQ